jgi:hypothetical protein
MRGLRLVAAALVSAGVFLIASGGSQDIARGALIAGLFYAVMYLVIEWLGRRRH